VDLVQTWVLDASPSARPGAFDDPENSVARVLDLMTRLPKEWPTRDAFVQALVGEGQTTALAQWLAMNLVPAEHGLVNRLDLGAMRELLADYYALDLWDAAFAPRGELDVVIAGKSSTLSADDRARLATAPAHVHVEVIDAGHWLHIEAPAAVIELFATRLP
jgi:pimeloyl-ACP methyl ester carboxylesterase